MSSNITNRFSALFFSGIHMDILGKLDHKAISGASNPGILSRMPGGASLNCASVARQMGLECAIIGIMGNDEDAKIIKHTLKERNIGNLLHTDPNHPTGNYISIVNPSGELEIAFNDLRLNETMQASWLLSQYGREMEWSKIWVLNANLNAATLNQLTERKTGTRPDILAAASISLAKSKNLSQCLHNIDLLFTNISEASAMLAYRDNQPYNGKNLAAITCVEQLMNCGVKMGSLTQGNGNVWAWQDGIAHEFAPPIVRNICDVIGAGDAFAGAIIAQLAQGENLQRATPIAIAAAQMILSTDGPWHEKLNIDELKKNALAVKVKTHKLSKNEKLIS